MNRTRRLKLVYFGAMAVGGLIGLGLVVGFRSQPAVLVVVAVMFFIPGRVTGYLWRELIAARRLMDSNRHGEAFVWLNSFILRLEAKPWLERIIWISPSIYTVKAKAMALNNRGVCQLETGALDLAEQDFNKALQLDSKYPIPHHNLAVIEMVRGNDDQAQRHLRTSSELGYTGDSIDQMLNRVKTVYAKVELAAKVRSL